LKSANWTPTTNTDEPIPKYFWRDGSAEQPAKLNRGCSEFVSEGIPVELEL